jgi:hypothetical protein
MNPVWKKLSGGCNMNRDIPALLDAAGLEIQDDNRMYVPGLKSLSYMYWGAATIR